MPPSARQARLDKLPVEVGFMRPLSFMAAYVAEHAGRDDIVGAVTSAILAGEQMFCRALEAPNTSRLQAMVRSKLDWVRAPHGMLAVVTTTTLTFKGQGAGTVE